MTAVSAPGKAFLFGEYAVLDGAPALIAAVNVRGHAWTVDADTRPGDAPCDASPEVVSALALTREHLSLDPSVTSDARPALDSRAFSPGLRKLGFGSSAAVTVSTVAWCLAAAGRDLADANTLSTIFELSRAAHHQAQGGGSGGDVAAATFGGITRLHEGTTRAVVPASWLHVAFFDAGAPASTSRLVAQVRAAAQGHPDAHAAAVRTLTDAAVLGHEGLTHADPRSGMEALRRACEAHVAGLAALDAFAGTQILTDNIRAFVDLAGRHGVAAKPSGAGGGDILVAFSHDRADLDRLARAATRDAGIRPLGDIALSGDGVRAEAGPPRTSRIAGLYKRSVEERRMLVATQAQMSPDTIAQSDGFGLDEAEHMIENVVALMPLPVGVATNFTINGVDVLVPMCVEEASVVAAASNAARMIREGGGFVTHADPPWMIAQIQLVRASESSLDATAALEAVRDLRPHLLHIADEAHPRLVARGGGARDVEVRALAEDTVVVHVLVDCRDAMGANLINTVAEVVAPHLEEATGWNACLRILSNLSDARASHVTARVPPEALASEAWDGDLVVSRIVEASRFAELDPYRATTHNKGIMNGVDAVVLATGNDWRAMEASAHAYAARDGRYGPLATWRRDAKGWLVGQMSLPTALGVVGGATRTHPGARAALEILGHPNAGQLGQIIASVGLASNLAALRALATEGIQRGHMGLHSRSVAVAAGATGDEVAEIARALVASGEIKLERARALLAAHRARNAPEHATPPTGDR